MGYATLDITNWARFYFVRDSMDRGIFKPETDSECSMEAARGLLSDAKYYSSQWGPDRSPSGLRVSALAVIKMLAKLGIE
jgi:hypothetical protein